MSRYIYLLVSILCIYISVCTVSVYAGSSISSKGIVTKARPFLDTTAMYTSSVHGYIDIRKAPKSIYHYLRKLQDIRPEEMGIYHTGYVVLPGEGIVAPLVYTTHDIDMSSLADTKILNTYLHSGVLVFPGSSIWHTGNTIFAGHSSYYIDDAGRYKTVFTALIEADTGEEVWVYVRTAPSATQTKKTTYRPKYTRYTYRIYRSENILPQDVSILDAPDTGEIVTLFTCTPIGGSSGRWVVQARRM